MTGQTLALAFVITAIYLLAVRLIDLNEKEPSWAVVLLFVLGLAAGVALPSVVSSLLLEATTYQAALAKEVAKLLAFSVGFVILLAVRRQQGWLEVSGVIDGVVYGATTGLGFATGLLFVLYWMVPTSPALGGQGALSLVIPVGIAGLSQGLYGALIGAGFGAAVDSSSPIGRVLLPSVGFLSAFAAHSAYLALTRGDALGGRAAVVRTWIGLVIPLAFLLAVFLHGIGKEKRAIAEELASEEDAGAEPLSFTLRRARRLATLGRGDLRVYFTRRKIHNRQVMLALAKRRAKRRKEGQHRNRIEEEIQRLRSSVLQLREQL